MECERTTRTECSYHIRFVVPCDATNLCVRCARLHAHGRKNQDLCAQRHGSPIGEPSGAALPRSGNGSIFVTRSSAQPHARATRCVSRACDERGRVAYSLGRPRWLARLEPPCEALNPLSDARRLSSSTHRADWPMMLGLHLRTGQSTPKVPLRPHHALIKGQRLESPVGEPEPPCATESDYSGRGSKQRLATQASSA